METTAQQVFPVQYERTRIGPLELDRDELNRWGTQGYRLVDVERPNGQYRYLFMWPVDGKQRVPLEYLIEDTSDPTVQRMNERGDHGWELITTFQVDSHFVSIFVRPMVNE